MIDLATYWKDLPDESTPFEATFLNAWGVALNAVAAAAALPADATVAGFVTGSSATKTALNGIYAPLASPAFTGTPTGITKAHVGLPLVDNTADASKPVSTAQAAAILAIKPTARFKGSLLTGVAVPAGNIAFTTLDDPGAGWNATNNNWVCAVAGTYVVLCSVKCNGTAVSGSIIVVKNGTNAINSPNFPSLAYGGGTLCGYLRLAIGDTVSMRTGATYTTQSDTPADNNYLELVQVQF